MTVMFCDMKGFTTLSEGVTPQGLVKIMNLYLSTMSEPIHAHRGVIDKYIGDAIMAYWGPPFVEEAEQAHFACLAAVDMIGRVETLLKELPEHLGVRTIPADCDIRIGIATGEALVGSIGSEYMMSFTVMGDTVNLASRLEGANKVYGSRCLISEATAKMCAAEFEVREIDRLVVVGQSQPQTVYEIMGTKGELVTPQQTLLRTHYAEGLSAYRARRWDEARRLLPRRSKAVPGDGPSMAMIARIGAFAKSAAGGLGRRLASGTANRGHARKDRCASALWTTVTTGTEFTAPLRFPRAWGSIGSSYGDGRPSRRIGQRNRDRPDEQRPPIRTPPGDRPPASEVLKSPVKCGRRRETGKAVRATGRPFSRAVGHACNRRRRSLIFCLRTISAQTLSVCREGKPLHTFPDRALFAPGKTTCSQQQEQRAIALISRNGPALFPSIQHNHVVLIAHLPFPSPAALENLQVEHGARQPRRRDFPFGAKVRAVAGFAASIEFIVHGTGCFTKAGVAQNLK